MFTAIVYCSHQQQQDVSYLLERSQQYVRVAHVLCKGGGEEHRYAGTVVGVCVCVCVCILCVSIRSACLFTPGSWSTPDIDR